jgi:hypothetical protein
VSDLRPVFKEEEEEEDKEAAPKGKPMPTRRHRLAFRRC